MNNDYNYDNYQGSNEVYPSYTEVNNFKTNNMNLKPPKKRRKWPIILLILLLLIVGVLIYLTFFTDKLDFIKPNDNYSEFDPDKGKIESNSNITSNTNKPSNSNKKSNSNSSSNSNSNLVVEKINITPTTPSVVVGSTITLKANVIPSGAKDKTIVWKSSDTKIATVNSKGIVTGVKAGTATITATAKNGKKNSVKVTVTNKVIHVTGIKLNVPLLRISYNGSTTLIPTITPNNATNKSIKWSSSNTKIVTVDQNGQIKGVGPGTATITATTVDGNKSANCVITVKAPEISSINISSSYYIYIGKPVKATVSYYPSNAGNQTVKWSSGNTNIATVNANGYINGIKEGEVTITATTPNGKKDSMKLYVRENPDDYSVLLISQVLGGGEGGARTAYIFVALKNDNQIYNINTITYNSKNYKINQPYEENEITINKNIKKVNITPTSGMKIYDVSLNYNI